MSLLSTSDCCNIQVLLSEQALFCNCCAAVGCPQRGVLYLPGGISGAMQRLLRWISRLGPCGCLSFQLLVARQDILGARVAPQQHLVFVALVNGDSFATSSPVVKVFLGSVFHCVTQLWQPLVHQINTFIPPPAFCSWGRLCRGGLRQREQPGREPQLQHCSRAWAALPGKEKAVFNLRLIVNDELSGSTKKEPLYLS